MEDRNKGPLSASAELGKIIEEQNILIRALRNTISRLRQRLREKEK